jgi:pyruvate kinase
MNSMKVLPYPIRAEASDVYNAVIDGVDCFVLRLKYNPNNTSFEMLNNIILKAEEDPKTKVLKGDTSAEERGTDSAIIASAVRSAVELHSPCILCMVNLGSTTA